MARMPIGSPLSHSTPSRNLPRKRGKAKKRLSAKCSGHTASTSNPKRLNPTYLLPANGSGEHRGSACTRNSSWSRRAEDWPYEQDPMEKPVAQLPVHAETVRGRRSVSVDSRLQSSRRASTAEDSSMSDHYLNVGEVMLFAGEPHRVTRGRATATPRYDRVAAKQHVVVDRLHDKTVKFTTPLCGRYSCRM